MRRAKTNYEQEQDLYRAEDIRLRRARRVRWRLCVARLIAGRSGLGSDDPARLR